MVVKLKSRVFKKRCYKCCVLFIPFRLRSRWSNICKKCRAKMIKDRNKILSLKMKEVKQK